MPREDLSMRKSCADYRLNTIEQLIVDIIKPSLSIAILCDHEPNDQASTSFI
jgi:hypothetical protein